MRVNIPILRLGKASSAMWKPLVMIMELSGRIEMGPLVS